MMKPQLSIVIVAAGSGTRLGSNIPKQFLQLGKMPVFCWSLETFCSLEKIIKDIVVVVSKDFVELTQELVKPYAQRSNIKVVSGGSQRHESVLNGILATERAVEWVAVHDAARPFVTSELVEQLFESALCFGAAVPGVSVQDTIKRVDDAGFIEKNIERHGLWAIQTPQVCKKNDLLCAYEVASKQVVTATDEAGLLELIGVSVHIVQSTPENFKITTPYDFEVAQYRCSQVKVL